MRNAPLILLVQHRLDTERLHRERISFASAMDLPIEQIRPMNASHEDVMPAHLTKADALVIAGSPCMVYDDTTPRLQQLLELVQHADHTAKPMFGVCFGAQLIARAMRGVVEQLPDSGEHGTTDIEFTQDAAQYSLYKGLPKSIPVQQSHHACITQLPDDATLIASNAVCIQAFSIRRRIHATQFHPERTRADAEWIRNRSRTLPPKQHPLRETPHAPSILRRFRERI